MVNLWQFLGLPPDHRPEDKTVQLVKHHEDVIKKVAYPRLAQIKKDGVFALVVMDGVRTAVFGRTGKRLSSVEHLHPTVKAGSLPMGRVAIIAELCCDVCSLETLSGIVNPNRKKPLTEAQHQAIQQAHFAVHDMVYISELIDGVSERPYGERLIDLSRTLRHLDFTGYRLPAYTVSSEIHADGFAADVIAEGEEGAVFKDPEAGWIAGRKNEVATKIVKGVDFDLEVITIEEGKGKHSGMVGKLIVKWRPYGDLKAEWLGLDVDGCFTQDMRKEWFKNPELILGKIVHVHALCIGSKGSLRLPKVQCVRIDKTEADL